MPAAIAAGGELSWGFLDHSADDGLRLTPQQKRRGLLRAVKVEIGLVSALCDVDVAGIRGDLQFRSTIADGSVGTR